MQNLVALTLPNRAEWAGRDEFERAAAETAYFEAGVTAVQALALELPLEVVYLIPARLGPYDFDAGLFPFADRWAQRYFINQDRGLLTMGVTPSLTLGQKGARVYLSNAMVADHWIVDEAQARSAQEPIQRGATTPAARVRLTDMRPLEQSWQFEGELLSVEVYPDQRLQGRLGEVGMEPR